MKKLLLLLILIAGLFFCNPIFAANISELLKGNKTIKLICPNDGSNLNPLVFSFLENLDDKTRNTIHTELKVGNVNLKRIFSLPDNPGDKETSTVTYDGVFGNIVWESDIKQIVVKNDINLGIAKLKAATLIKARDLIQRKLGVNIPINYKDLSANIEGEYINRLNNNFTRKIIALNGSLGLNKNWSVDLEGKYTTYLQWSPSSSSFTPSLNFTAGNKTKWPGNIKAGISKDILNAEKKANIMYLLKFGKTKDRASTRSSKRRFALSCERIEKNNS